MRNNNTRSWDIVFSGGGKYYYDHNDRNGKRSCHLPSFMMTTINWPKAAAGCKPKKPFLRKVGLRGA